ncbi:MAG: replicative DNA helicase [Helicobacteraceae bacterium]|nr:replicative DNA helicase [Helicobacteraceae bacterium]
MEEHLYNLAFERSVLSSIIFEPEQFDDISNILSKDDFYLPAHAEIYDSMTILTLQEQPIAEEFLKKELGKKNKFDEGVMLEILSANPISNTAAYIEELKDKAMKRHLLTLTTEIKHFTIEEQLPSSEVIDLVEKKLFEITQSATKKEFREAPEVAQATLEYIEEMKARGDTVLVGVDTGFHELNKMTTGFGKGDLVIIAARPAMGKTSFVLNTVSNLLDKGKGVAFFSLEMPAEQLMLRLLSMKTSIYLTNLRVGNIDAKQQADLDSEIAKMKTRSLFIDDQGSLNINQLKSRLRKLKQQHPEIEMAVIDYIQIMSETGGGRGRQDEVSAISRGLKMLARELEMPILALSQLNRGLEGRADKRPMLSDIRESGAIEQDADIIMFVYRDDVYLFKEEKEREKQAKADGKEFISNYVEREEEEAEIIIGKQRNGPTGHVKLTFQKKFTRFVNAEPKKAFEVVYENVDMGEAQMNVEEESISMPMV